MRHGVSTVLAQPDTPRTSTQTDGVHRVHTDGQQKNETRVAGVRRRPCAHLCLQLRRHLALASQFLLQHVDAPHGLGHDCLELSSPPLRSLHGAVCSVALALRRVQLVHDGEEVTLRALPTLPLLLHLRLRERQRKRKRDDSNGKHTRDAWCLIVCMRVVKSRIRKRVVWCDETLGDTAVASGREARVASRGATPRVARQEKYSTQ
jgi:hypothetical protein